MLIATLAGTIGVVGVAAPALPAQQVASESASKLPVTDVLQRTVSVDFEQTSLKRVIDGLAASAKIRIIYRDALLDTVTKSISLHVKQVSLGAALNRILQGTGLYAAMTTADVVSIKAVASRSVQQDGIVTGTVRDAKTKQPLRGVLVLVDDATKGVTTDNNGIFKISNVASRDHILHVRKLGYEKYARKVTVLDAEQTSVDVTLEASVNTLEQVVVTGTVVPTELKAIPNAITVITAKELQDRGITRIDQLFRGDVPGLFTQRTGVEAASWLHSGVQGFPADQAPGAASVSARGSTNLSFNGGNESIKVYVDGVELANRSYLGLIDPTAIERIEILTGPEASTIYGSNAINGVMQIFTKRGSSSRPQVTAEARSSWTQNNMSSAIAPKHTADLSLSGVDGRMSYNVGGSWGYTGSWTPGVRDQTVSGFAGERMTAGRLTLDGNLRVMQDGNLARAADDLRPVIEGILSGNGPQVVGGGSAPRTHRGTSTDRTVGGTGTYTVTPWWSHTVTLGSDQLTTFSTSPGKRYSEPTDTAAFLGRNTYSRFTAAYNTTVQVPLASLAKAVVTLGVDESHATNTSVGGSYMLVDGEYRPTRPNAWRYRQNQAHEHGGFLQSQVGFWDALFVTYGLRAVYNPNLGKNQNPNLEPRYGIALTQEFGAVTAKLRASYGTATRPPLLHSKDALGGPDQMLYYGVPYWQLANSDLMPESQQGGEGGLELYVGTRGSIQVTRYNQTVDHLIVSAVVDSIDILPVWKQQQPWCVTTPFSCALRQTQNLNIGSVRNEGWETRGTLNLWRFTATGTYSWNKSRLIGITPKYRGQFPYYVVGAPFQLMPEHTYALGLAYVRGGTRVSYNIQGQGAWQSYGFFFLERTGNQYATRLPTYNSRVTSIPDAFTEVQRGYLLGDLNVSQQVTSRVEALVQINNLTNNYQSEIDPTTLQSGRTTGLGLRIHF